MAVGEAFCRSMSGSFGRRVLDRKGKSTIRTSTCSTEDKVPSFCMMQVVQQSQPATRLKLVTLGSGAMIRARCWSLPLAECHTSAAVARSDVVTWLFSMLPNSISATLFMDSLGNDRGR